MHTLGSSDSTKLWDCSRGIFSHDIRLLLSTDVFSVAAILESEYGCEREFEASLIYHRRYGVGSLYCRGVKCRLLITLSSVWSVVCCLGLTDYLAPIIKF
jgi:hypothetical protein